MKTIYLVDDDDDDRMLFREAIEGVIEDVRIIEIVDGKDLLDLITSQDVLEDPVLILMDMNMPRVSGLEALVIIKSDTRRQHIPIVMISTTSNPELVRQAYADGINAYMTKPILIEEYTQMAEAVNVCFINRSPSFKGLPFTKSFKASSVLFIEDNADHWMLMDHALKHSMTDVKITGMYDMTGTMHFLSSALLKLQPFPQLIILDLYLPTRRDGLNLLDEIRNFFFSNNLIPVPIIVLSSSDHQDDIRASYRHKANAYMVKSMDPDKWFPYFKDLCNFWWGTITLPQHKYLQ